VFSITLRVNGITRNTVITIHTFIPILINTISSGSVQDSLMLHRNAKVVKIHVIPMMDAVKIEQKTGCFANFLEI